MATKRKAISKKARFEVFKRDSFTCQYCGGKAPDVILHVDHIDPVSKGGGNDILNLITACAGCNGGKGATRLDDASALAKQRQQLEELSARREQLKMMLDWRKGMKSVDDMALSAAVDHFAETFPGWHIESEAAVSRMRKLVRDFGLQSVMDAIDIARDTYATVVDKDSVNLAFSKVGGICRNRSRPDETGLYYARGILRKRVSYCNEGIAISLLRRAREAGADDDLLKDVTREARNWSGWCADMNDIIEGRWG